MSDIFLSYKSEDRAKAQIIVRAFEQKGYLVWWDRNILIGKPFDLYILEKLNDSKCVVVLWSNKSIISENVKDEAREGYKKKTVFPVLIEDVEPPLGFRGIQTAKLIDWDGTLPNDDFELLLESVKKIIGRPLHEEIGATHATEGIAKLKAEEKIITNSIGMKFTLIPAGEFMMGSYEIGTEKPYENPVHKVTISTPFYLGIYPVTQQEWSAVMKNNPSYFKGDKLPVEQVSWNDVAEFIKKLNEKEGISKYRLPCEAEWEYAARAGTTTRYSFGDDESKLGDYAWYAENSGSRHPENGDYFGYDKNDWFENKWNGKTHPVGEKKPNLWGLYDMHGNVWEWVQDKCHEDYTGAPMDGSAWESGDDSIRIDRGGGWGNFAKNCQSAKRDKGGVDYSDLGLGFRLLRIF